MLFIGAWFVQMGVHEGAHAYAAHRLGDDTAYLLGKRSFNPLNHIEWKNINSVLLSVVVPIYTALIGLVPLGMAWVPVNPLRLKKWQRDMALVSFAGPAANLIVMLICIGLHSLISPVISELHPADMESFQRLLWVSDQFLRAICVTSALYGFFNLLPIPPLDGSKVLRFFLPPGGREVMDNIEPYGIWILMILFWSNSGVGVIIDIPIAFVMSIWNQVG